jgi:hypothetical protein
VKRPSRRKSKPEERGEAMSVISEEVDRKETKVDIIYIKSARPKSSKHSSRKVTDENEKTSKVSVRSIHQSSTTSSRRRATIPPIEIPKRYDSLIYPTIYKMAEQSCAGACQCGTCENLGHL